MTEDILNRICSAQLKDELETIQATPGIRSPWERNASETQSVQSENICSTSRIYYWWTLIDFVF